jgi:hypothetical protein
MHCIHTSLYTFVRDMKLVFPTTSLYIYGINTWENLIWVLIGLTQLGLTQLICTHVCHTCVTMCSTRVYKLAPS